jgi:hypothetical protein
MNNYFKIWKEQKERTEEIGRIEMITGLNPRDAIIERDIELYSGQEQDYWSRFR